MIDFVKILVEGIHGKYLKDNPRLDFKKVVSEKGKFKSISSVAHKRDLKFTVFDNGTTRIQGSLHKYYNNGQHNYNDFTYSRLKETLHHFSKSFRIDLEKCKLQNLEVGLNIIPCLNTHELLENIVLHKGAEFNRASLQSGNYKQAIHTAYKLKAYDKALHYNLPHPIFRWEIKMMKSELIKRYGVKYLSDLYDKRNLQRLLKDLIVKWEETLVLDPTIKLSDVNANDFPRLTSWRFPNYWIKQRKIYTGNKRYLYTKELNEYKTMVSNNSDNIHQLITNIMKEKKKYCLVN